MDHLTTLHPDELFAELDRLQSENRALTAESLSLRRAHEESRLDAERYRLITANTVDLVGEVSQHGVYTYVSANHEETLGYPARQLLGRNFVTLVHPEDMDDVVEKFSACIVEGLPFVRRRSGCGTRTAPGAGWKPPPPRSKPLPPRGSPPTRDKLFSSTAT